MLSFERFTHFGMYLWTEIHGMKAFKSQRIFKYCLKLLHLRLHASPVSFSLFSWHNAQARSVTSQCSFFSSSLSYIHALRLRDECKDRWKRNTHHIGLVCQLLSLVMWFSHFYTFYQYAIFFSLKNHACSSVVVAANFRSPALFCCSLF